VSELTDLGSHDPGRDAGPNLGHTSTSRTVAQEADDFDGLAYIGKILTGVLVELVDRIRVLQGERNAVEAPHDSDYGRSGSVIPRTAAERENHFLAASGGLPGAYIGSPAWSPEERTARSTS